MRDSWPMVAVHSHDKRRDDSQQHPPDRQDIEHHLNANKPIFTKNPLVGENNHAFTHDDDVSHVTLRNEIDELFQSQPIIRKPCDSTDEDNSSDSLSTNDGVTPAMFRNFIPRMGPRKIFSDNNISMWNNSNYKEQPRTTTL